MGIRRLSGILAAMLGLTSLRLWAAPITFNTALPVAAGQVMVRLDAMGMGAGAAPMNQDLTVIALPAALAFGLSRKVTLIAMGPLFTDKSLSLDTPAGRITREARGLGDLAFLA